MPHVLQASIDSNATFDLTKDERSDSAQPDDAVDQANDLNRVSRASSGMYGLALTSELLDNDIAMQHERRDEVKTDLKRRSMPGSATGYLNLTADQDIDTLASTPEVVESDDGRNYSYNTNVSRRSAQYFDNQSQYKDYAATSTPAKQRVQRQSPVIAELKTNVIIKDEFTLVTDLSHQLAQRYNRFDSSVMVRVDHTACLALGGTFDPCYLLTIHSVHNHMGPATNKRNASLIQSFMADILSVPAERGIVTFVPIPEENLAIGGNTLRSEMDKAEKLDAATGRKAAVEAARRSAGVKRSMPNLHASGTLINGHSIQKPGSRDSDSDRPKTAHGPSQLGAVNGLRMNPISADELRGNSPRNSTTRPRSIGAPERSSLTKPLNSALMADATRLKSSNAVQARQPKPELKARSVPADIRKKTASPTPQSTTAPLLAPRPVQAPPTIYNASAVTPFTAASTTSTKISGPPAINALGEARSKAVYLDMVTALPTDKKGGAFTVRSEELDALRSISSDDLAATAPVIQTKRRSATITAAPKLPPQPLSPAFFEKEETKSMSSRLSKRKSFMKLFKRESSLPKWYESV